MSIDPIAAQEPARVNTDPVLDPWQQLRRTTQARIGLGRVGHAWPTTAVLQFQTAHALARDAVATELDVERVTAQLRDAGDAESLVLDTAAPDRRTYLQRPDLGRRLSVSAREMLAKCDCDVVFVLADGLSAHAVAEHAVSLLVATRALLPGWTFGPTVIARQARIAVADEVGELLGARLSVVLVGERPGLSSSDSLGAYLTYQPRVGRLDSERNCISNIRPPEGLSIDAAAQTLARLLIAARRLGLTGTALKDDADPGPILVPALPIRTGRTAPGARLASGT